MEVSRQSRLAPTQHYRPDIDGLRALAVLAVVLYHAGLPLVSGGYVGVDVFFVISGYLISRNVADEIAAGRFTFAGFYERRARRILPALSAMLIGSAMLAALLLTPAEVARYGRTLLAATLGLSNMLFRAMATAGGGYFQDTSEPQLLLHTWSLGVEEQFYVLLPFVLLALRPLGTRTAWAVLLGLALASFAWSAWTLGFKPNYTFYVVFPRAWELLAGSLLALRPRRAEVLQPAAVGKAGLAREIAALAGLGAIGFAVLGYGKATLFPGPAALPPVLGACSLIWAGEARRRTLAARLLTLRPVVFIGLISYSLYLWHWPVLVAEKLLVPFAPPPAATALALGLAFALAVLSYLLVEQPFRRRQLLAGRRAVFTAGGAAMAAMLLLGASAALGGGWSWRFDARTVAVLAGNEARALDVIPNSCLDWRRALRDAPTDALCPIRRGGATKVAFIGDSHVAQMRSVVVKLAEEGAFGDRDIIFPVTAGCVQSTSMNLVRPGARCPSAMRMATALAADETVDTVFLGFSAWFEVDPGKICLSDGEERCLRVLGPAEIADRLAVDLARTVTALRERGKLVVVMLPLPIYDNPIPVMQTRMTVLRARHLDAAADAIAAKLHRRDFEATRERVRAAVAAAGAVVYDPRPSLCDGAGCSYAVDGVALYSDADHLAGSQAGVLHDGLDALFRGLRPPRPVAMLSAKADGLP